jgi:hypothetical protein
MVSRSLIAGYWHEEQIDQVVNTGTQVVIPPDAGKCSTPRRGWNGGCYAFMCSVLASELGGGLYRTSQGDGRARFRSNQAQPAHQSVPAARQIRRTL